MGWVFMRKPQNVAEWAKSGLSWSNGGVTNKCLDIALVNFTELYAAVETIHEDGRREVWAAVYLIRFTQSKDGYDFGYKDMTEHDGPNVSSCPKRILDRLTPTDGEYANAWRQRCRERLSVRATKKLKVGDFIKFEYPLNFIGYGEFDTFRVTSYGNKVRFKAIDNTSGQSQFICQITKFRDRSWVKLEGDDIPRPQNHAPRM